MEHVETLPPLPARAKDAHKGSFGRVLVVGGSRGMVGAVALAANGALRGGAGLVTFAAPEAIQLTVAALCPCATSVPLTCGPDGEPAADALRQVARAAKAADVLAVGPGMAQGPTQRDLVRAALEQDKPVVLDADGLNNLGALDGWPALRRCGLVLTPHPGEFSRLTGRPIGEIQSDRQAAALAAAGEWARAATGQAPLVVLLKGAGTVVTDGRRVRINRTGNPGMATGGSGDVLTGLIAALLAQGLSPFDAASLGAHLHGRAGDLAAEQLSPPAMIAWDLLEYLPAAMKAYLDRRPGGDG
ncbi:MAG TPA: NAD(P)H-hydrate dehydratase [Phycisphaerae bacterium]|nr:NAD(P)H-hydrate dehydratase [Phycisphaerae bacterium]